MPRELAFQPEHTICASLKLQIIRTGSLLRVIVLIFVVVTSALGAPVLTVTSPQSGWSVNSPIYYAASARSPGCVKGIAAMRIYAAPHLAVFSIDAPQFETFVNLKPGTYNTVVQAWDNCGGVTKAAVKVTVAASGGVTVYSPANHTVATSPMRFIAGASSPGCAGGISAIHLYTAPGVDAYSERGNHVDTKLDLTAATYDAVVQASDNCGHIFKVPVKATVRPATVAPAAPASSASPAPLH